MTINSTRSGFSYISLILVVASLALMAGIVAPRVAQRKLEAHDAQRLMDVEVIHEAIEHYFEETGTYPKAKRNGQFGGWDVSHDGGFIDVLVDEGYLDAACADPVNDDTHHYGYFVYNRGSYGCSGPGKFYVLGIRNFETLDAAEENPGHFDCSGRNWGDEFDWITGGGASDALDE